MYTTTSEQKWKNGDQFGPFGLLAGELGAFCTKTVKAHSRPYETVALDELLDLYEEYINDFDKRIPEHIKYINTVIEKFGSLEKAFNQSKEPVTIISSGRVEKFYNIETELILRDKITRRLLKRDETELNYYA